MKKHVCAIWGKRCPFLLTVRMGSGHVCAYTGDSLDDFVVVEPSERCPLRQALKALESGAWDTLRGRNAAAAIRERLGEGEHQ